MMSVYMANGQFGLFRWWAERESEASVDLMVAMIYELSAQILKKL